VNERSNSGQVCDSQAAVSSERQGGRSDGSELARQLGLFDAGGRGRHCQGGNIHQSPEFIQRLHETGNREPPTGNETKHQNGQDPEASSPRLAIRLPLEPSRADYIDGALGY
jgi:hypothetical protein